MPDLPIKFRAWEQPSILTTAEVIKKYEQGFAGCIYDPEADAEIASYGAESIEEVCRDFGYEEDAAGKLVLPYRFVEKYYPKAYPGPGQTRGSCVVHCTRNAELITMVCEVEAGLPDALTGKMEECPKVSEIAEKQGVLATEPPYHYRDHKSDGWWCSAAANVVVKYAGAAIRKDYGFIDLTRLNESYAGKYWNASQIPSDAKDAFNDNLFRDAAEANTPEAIRDILSRGIGISSCGSEAFSSTRDANGVARKQGSWAHAMAIIGVDDRPIAHQKYGGILFLVQNSWGLWNSGPRRIMDTNIDIPEGCFWARWNDIKKRSFVGIAGLNGWTRNSLPDYDPNW